MELYHGTDHPALELHDWIVSRYGITALFATPDQELAMRYARHAKRRRGKGYLYSLRASPAKTLDWRGRISYSAEFRNMVYREKQSGTASLLVTNVVDYPDSEQAVFLPSSVAILYDVAAITNLQLVTKI